MKKRIFLYVQLAVLILLSSCKEEPIGQYGVDGIPPKPVTNATVAEQFGGGVVIRYDIPDDDDLLYVKASYTINTGAKMEVKSSLYKNQIEIVGYSREGDYPVTLTCVDRSRNESEPVTLTIRPLDSPIHTILESLQVYEDFGGIQLNWMNPVEQEITVMVSTPIQDDSELTENVNSFHSKATEGIGNVRGFPSEPKKFIIQIQDRWGNLTDEVSDTYLPKYEEECNKARFAKWTGDPGVKYTEYNTSSWKTANLWDGSLTSGFHTKGSTTPLSNKFTFDLGAVYTLSRLKLWHRSGTSYVFYHVNPRNFILYGSETAAARAEYDDSDDPAHEPYKWKKLGEFYTVKPSGLPVAKGNYTDEDNRVATIDGIDCTFPIELSTPVRYLRFDLLECWDGTCDNFHIMEMSFWGQPADRNKNK